jgi:type IV secretory pathway VirJ component
MKKAPSLRGWLLCVVLATPLAFGLSSSAYARKATPNPSVQPKTQTPAQAQNSAPPSDAAKAPPLVPADDPYIKTFQFAPMGEVYVYLPKTIDDDTDVILFASGDGGWEPRVVDIVVRMQALGKIVVGFSTPEYLKRLDASALKCAYPPQELEALSQFVQRKLEIRSYRVPMLVGYSSGASLAYVAAAQTPINTFAGAIGLGFCEDLALQKPLCRQGALKTTPVKEKPDADGVRLLPIEHLVAPYELLQGQADEACTLTDVSAFMNQTDATLHALPKVGHGFGAINEWFPQFVAAYKALDDRRPIEMPPSSMMLGDLPLIERPVSGGNGTFVVMLSGDGGWSTLTEKVTDELNDDGYSVVGWNMLKYFWTAKTPEHAADDLGTIIRYFTDAWHKQDVIVAGYSMGADVLPALVNRLPVAEQQRVRSIVLMAPERATDFEFHVSGWLHRVPKDASAIAPEVANLPEGVRMTCIYGADEADSSLCTQVDPKKTSLTLKELPGAHHFDGDYEALAKLVR